MMPFDAYRCYLSLKNHFTKDHYDYYKNEGRTRVKKKHSIKEKIDFGLKNLQDKRMIKRL